VPFPFMASLLSANVDWEKACIQAVLCHRGSGKGTTSVVPTRPVIHAALAAGGHASNLNPGNAEL
jgi:hypothetical protein